MTLAWERRKGPLYGGSGGERLQGLGHGSAFGDPCLGAPAGTLAQLLSHRGTWTVVVGVEMMGVKCGSECERYWRHLVESISMT